MKVRIHKFYLSSGLCFGYQYRQYILHPLLVIASPKDNSVYTPDFINNSAMIKL